jgi:hypothetical protein
MLNKEIIVESIYEAKIQTLSSPIIYKYKVICINKFIAVILNGGRTIKITGKTMLYE